MGNLSKNDQFDLPNIDQTYDNFFNQITKLDEDDIVVRSNCKFCKHPARLDAELLYEKCKTFAPLMHFFDEYNKTHSPIQMAPQNIRNHIMHHYSQQEKKLWIREYSSRLKDFMNFKLNKEKMLDTLMASLQMKFIEIASDNSLPCLKSAETLTKLSKSIIELAVEQSRIKGEIQSSQLIVEKFMNIWVQMISTQTDPSVKNILLTALDGFQQQLEKTPLLVNLENNQGTS